MLWYKGSTKYSLPTPGDHEVAFKILPCQICVVILRFFQLQSYILKGIVCQDKNTEINFCGKWQNKNQNKKLDQLKTEGYQLGLSTNIISNCLNNFPEILKIFSKHHKYFFLISRKNPKYLIFLFQKYTKFQSLRPKFSKFYCSSRS